MLTEKYVPLLASPLLSAHSLTPSAATAMQRAYLNY
jgi:hypothetical protein